MEINASAINYNNRPAIMSINRDISERKKSEEYLRSSEEQFRTSVENLLDSFVILTSIRDRNNQVVDFKYAYINKAALQSIEIMTKRQVLEKR